jgi:glyoxalase family protein
MGMADMPTLSGLHHVTAIASEPQKNLDFYSRFLGLRLVKRTVNFDDPGTYHFYFGNDTGAPGTLITFFPWPGARRGRAGTGQVNTTSFAIPVGSLGFWSDRGRSLGIEMSTGGERFGEPVLRLADPDGMELELIETEVSAGTPATAPDIPPDCGISGVHSVTMAQEAKERTAELLERTLGFRFEGEERARFRYRLAGSGFLDVLCSPERARGSGGAGTVHHIALRTPEAEQQVHWRSVLVEKGFNVSPVMDRQYFESIYFREPGGVLFEIATDEPGFAIDEAPDELGSTLRLPPQYEASRPRIEAALPPIQVPVLGLRTTSY